jgi:lipopolysaccharide/colanic/teichoic acid biosynthesis glycosyltransferase
MGISARRYRGLFSGLVKRILDIAVSCMVLILLAPFFGLIALAIRRSSPGPAFYGGQRVGIHGKRFKMFKFRTMYESPESYMGPRVTAEDDPRVTVLGRWLRDTKLNELPQFWNVLRGEMSLVGPRPEDPTIVATWPDEAREEVLSALPGITSPASVLYRDEETLLCARNVLGKYLQELSPDKMRLDQLYVRYRSFWLDVDTMLWTALLLLPRLRFYSPPEELLFLGPVARFVRRDVSWFAIDLFVTLTTMGLAGLFWRTLGPLNVGWPRAIVLAFAFSLLFSVTDTVLGVNRISWGKATPSEVFDLLPAWALAAGIGLAGNAEGDLLPRGLMLLASALALGGFIVVRYRDRLATGLVSRIMHYRAGRGACGERVLIVGSGLTARHVAWLLAQPPNARQYSVVGFIDDDLMAQGMRIYGASVMGTCRNLARLVREHGVGIVILADDEIMAGKFQSMAETCEKCSAKLYVMPRLANSLNGACLPAWKGRPAAGVDGEDADSPCRHCLRRSSLRELEALAMERERMKVA